jgi:chromosome segregation ATPase
LEAREREIESLIRTVGSLDDLTEQRARELEKIRPANRELQERIFRLEDELRVARERQSLEERAFRLMGNNVALREIELRQTEVANRGLLRFIFALEDAAERVARAEDNVRQALAGVERAVQAENDRLRDLQTQIRERQREAETELLERIRLIDGALSTMRQRRAALDPMTEMARARSTLAIAQAGGVMSVGVDELEEALRIVSDPSEELYASFEDYQRDFLRTKRVIEDIERQAQTQHSETLSEFEQQLEALQSQIDQNDAILEEQRRAVNALFGIDDSACAAVEDAVNNLQGAMREFSAASRAQAGLIAGGIPRPPAAPGAPAAPAGPGLAELQAKGRVAAQIAMASGSLEASGLTAADLLRVGVSQNVTRSQVEAMREQVRALGGVPAFADGGVHIGGARIVGERGPELEMTGPSRIMSNDDLMSALRGDRSSAEIQAVRAEIAGLRSDLRQTQTQIVRHTKRTRDVLEGWDVEGLPEERVQA